MFADRPILLDVTRLIAFRWSGRHPTGIDRVCIAYLEHYAGRAQAVFQFRGFFRVLDPQQSDRLFALLARRTQNFRQRFLAIAPTALTRGSSRVSGQGRIYLNASHTDFDLSSHTDWVRACDLKPVYLIHDLIPISHSSHCRPRAVKRHLGRVVNSLRNAAGIIVNSAHTRDELVDFAQAHGHRIPPIVAAPLAVSELTNRAAGDTSPESYFLCIGTIEPRKNHSMLLNVWRRMIRRDGSGVPRLIIIGQWGAQSQSIRLMLRRDPHLAGHVTVLSRCSDQEMGRWIAGARAVLLPTKAEGYGLPLVEAMTLGAAVVASDLPAFRETGQGIPMLLDPDDEAAWTAAIRELDRGQQERNRQIRALGNFRPPVWREHFARVDNWLDTIHSRPSVRPQIAGPHILEMSARKGYADSQEAIVSSKAART